MKFCPECGFELKPGDEFCINCGASLIDYKDAQKDASEASSGKPKKNFFKTPGGIILIVVVALLVAAGVAFLIYFNSPKIKLLRAAKNTVEDVSSMKKVKIIDRVLNGGSIEAEASLQNIIEGFSIPLIGQIDATATVKYYMDTENDSCELSLSGGLGGSQALGADIWADPHRVIVKSPTLIGKTAYGFEASDEDSRNELRGLIKEYLDVDIKEADKYIEIADAYSKNKDELNKQLAFKLYEEAFRNGDVEKGKEEITIAGEDMKTESVYLALSGEQLRKMLNKTYDDLKDKEEFSEVASLIDEDELRDKIDDIPDDYELDFKFYINKKTRLVRVESRADKINVTAFIGPDPAEAKEFSVTVSDDSGNKGLTYRVDTDNDNKYLSHVSCQLPHIIEEKLGLLNVKVDFDELTGDISWNKTGGNWELVTNIGLSADGDFNYDGNKADGVIETIALESQKLSPKIRFKIREEDKMPKAPEYREIRGKEDLDALKNDILDSLLEICKQLIGSPTYDVLMNILGFDIPNENNEIEELPKDQIEESEESESKTITITIGGVKIEGLDIQIIQDYLNSFGLDIDFSGMDEDSIQMLIDSIGLDSLGINIESVKSFLQGTGKDTSIIDSVIKEIGKKEKAKKEKEEKEKETESGKYDKIENESRAISGTYSFSSGNNDSINPQTGKQVGKVDCTVSFGSNNTYSLSYSDSGMSFSDSGTYIINSDDSMVFNSSWGFSATGHYYSDHISINIPGYGNVNISKL